MMPLSSPAFYTLPQFYCVHCVFGSCLSVMDFCSSYSSSSPHTEAALNQITRFDVHLHVPNDEAEVNRVMQSILNQKVNLLKRVKHELQNENAYLTSAHVRFHEEKLDSDVQAYNGDVQAYNGYEGRLPPRHCCNFQSITARKNLTKANPERTLITNKLSKTFTVLDSKPLQSLPLSSDESIPPLVICLEERVKQLEQEVDDQKILIQCQELKFKSLLYSKLLLEEKFQKRLRFETRKISYETRLTEEKATHLMKEANMRAERSKQLEQIVSAMHEKFQDLLLNAQARSSQSRHDDLQRINELEKKLTKSMDMLGSCSSTR